MLTKEELLKGFEQSTDNLTDQLAAFDAKKFAIKPAPDKWSAFQVADHILLVDRVMVKVMSGFCATAPRDPFAKKQMIEDNMNDLDKKFISPEFILPSDTAVDKDAIISDILKERAMIRNLIMVSDITEVCLDSKHPGFGQLTRAEWVYFNICHTNRHAKQLERTAAAVAEHI